MPYVSFKGRQSTVKWYIVISEESEVFSLKRECASNGGLAGRQTSNHAMYPEESWQN